MAQTPNIRLVTVDTGNKKLKLSQTLFRQVIQEHVLVWGKRIQSPNPYNYSKLYKCDLDNPEWRGEIVGFVNYHWHDGKQTILRRQGNCVALYDWHDRMKGKHLLWVTPEGELRRCWMSDRLLERLGVNPPQVFLGSWLFATGV